MFFKKRHMERTKSKTSWEKVHAWYDKSVGDEGHYYHQHVVLPGVIKLLDLPKESTRIHLLDLACGNGVLAHRIPAYAHYTGIDVAPSLIKAACKNDTAAHHNYLVGDITQPLPTKQTDYTHAAIVLAVQNLEHPHQAFHNAAKHLQTGGKLVIAMNHPCFRIPRQSSWKVDEAQKIQFRRIDRYSTAMKIPIHTNPSKGNQSETTWSFHHPLASYAQWLNEAGFAIDLIEEWHSDKLSTGKMATMENRSREEIPLFLAIRATKVK